MKKIPRLVLIGDVGGIETYHVGDEAMLCANIDRLRQLPRPPSCTVISSDPQWTSRHYGVEAIPPIGFPGRQEAHPARQSVWNEAAKHLESFRRTGQADPKRTAAAAIRALSESDGLIISGGGNLCSTWPEHLWERAMLIRIADGLGKPSVLTGQTLGPHLTPANGKLLQEVLPLARLVGVRERPSAALAEALGVLPQRICYQLDDAFDLRPQPAQDLRRLAEGPPWIAVTISCFPDFGTQGFLESLAEQLGAISQATGARLVFLPHVAAPQGSSVWADLEVGRRLARLLEPSPGMELLEVRDCRETAWLTAQAALVLSTRYHSLVFGLANGVPGLGIYINQYTRVKLQGVLAHAGLQDWTMPMDLCLAGMLEKSALELWSRQKEVRHHLESLQRAWNDLQRSSWNRALLALGLQGAEPQPPPSAVDVGQAPRPAGAWPHLAATFWEHRQKRNHLISTLRTELRQRTSRFFYLKKALRPLLGR